MTHRKKETEREFLRPPIQPLVVSERLFNLMYLAHRQKRLFVVMDECENEFDHRDVHRLTLKEQNKLYRAARDELAKDTMKWGMVREDNDPGSLQ